MKQADTLIIEKKNGDSLTALVMPGSSRVVLSVYHSISCREIPLILDEHKARQLRDWLNEVMP